MRNDLNPLVLDDEGELVRQTDGSISVGYMADVDDSALQLLNPDKEWESISVSNSAGRVDYVVGEDDWLSTGKDFEIRQADMVSPVILVFVSGLLTEDFEYEDNVVTLDEVQPNGTEIVIIWFDGGV